MNARNRFLFLAAAAAVFMSATGCVCVVEGRQRGDITFLWSFGGRSCLEVPNVTQVRIAIPNQTLQNDGVYPCLVNNTAGIVLQNFRAGTYSYTIEGLTAGGATVYSAQGSVIVNGNVTETVDLSPVAGAPGNALITWTFPPNGSFSNPNCSQAGVVNVDIRIDNGAPQRVACASGFGTTGVQLNDVAAGAHTIDLAASDASNFYYYRKISSLTIVAGSTVSSAYSFEWGVGSLPMKWTFTNGSVAQTCAQAGIAQVNIVLENSATGDRPYGTQGQDVPCEASGVQGTLFPYLYPAGYKVYLQALGTGGALYRSNFTTPPVLSVAAGAFPQVDASTTVIQLFR